MTPTSHPLTHHEILRWVGPFTRRGRHVDLAASDRIARRLVFRSIGHDGVMVDGASLPGLRETLQLESLDDDSFRLTRVLSLDNGLSASLQTEGPDPGELLARIEAVPVECPFRVGPGYVIAQSHRMDGGRLPSPDRPSGADIAKEPLVLTRGIARIGALMLTLVPPTVRGMSADLTLTAPLGEAMTLPDDLLAVLGRDWSRLGEAGEGWRSSLRLRGDERARSRDAEAKLVQAATHLARCLEEPPARFHERHVAARWRVYAWRSVPLLACAALVLAAASVPKLNLADNSPWRMLIFNAPPLLLILVFCLRELPRIELPPWPRPATAATWRNGPTAKDACSATR
jgi:hypothetical protein